MPNNELFRRCPVRSLMCFYQLNFLIISPDFVTFEYFGSGDCSVFILAQTLVDWL